MSDVDLSSDDDFSVNSEEYDHTSDLSDGDISDSELIPDLVAEKPVYNDGLEQIVIVDGCPVVGTAKLEKLVNVIRKHFGKTGEIISDHFPMKDDTSTGYAFLRYKTKEEAAETVRQMNGKPLDKAHTFQVTLMSTFDSDVSVSTEFSCPPKQEYVDMGNLRIWLQDEQCRDQLAVIHAMGETTTVLWYGPNSEYQFIEGAQRKRWTESILSWSSTGIMLATFHLRGIALWGGENFSRIRRFQHPGVSLVSFSPCDKYMVTFSMHADTKEDPSAIIVWNVRTGEKGRGFHCETTASWPVFKWSCTGQYFARLLPNMISVYETPSLGLIDKKSIKIPGVSEFMWSPNEKMIAYWVQENENSPARVVLMEIPSRRELCSKNLFSVSDIKMEWQKQGDFLCVLVTRYAKKKLDANNIMRYSGLYYNLEVFRLREKHIPVDNIEVKSPVTCFSLEPYGNKFALVCAESTSLTFVKFYEVHPGGKVEHVKSLERIANRRVEELYWSPKGGILAMKNNEGNLEFVDTSDMTSIANSQHIGCNGLEWDPSGRYVCTWVSFPMSKQDCHVWIWSSTGRLLTKLNNIDGTLRASWRPRPPCLLSEAELKDVKRNMRRYTANFEMLDRMRSTHANKAQIEKRSQQSREFTEWRTHLYARYESEREDRQRIRPEMDNDDSVEEEISILIDVNVTKCDVFE